MKKYTLLLELDNEKTRKLLASRKIWLELLQVEEDLSLLTEEGRGKYWNDKDVGIWRQRLRKMN